MEILKRVGIVVATSIGTMITFALATCVIGAVNHFLKGGDFDDAFFSNLGEGAAVIGFGLGGALGALSGGAVSGELFRGGGTNSLAGDGPNSITSEQRTARVVSWAVAIALAIFCFWRLTQS